MSIITLANRNNKETGQSLAAVALAANFAVMHNYKILLIATDFKDRTLENCFFKHIDKINLGLFFQGRHKGQDVANGLEGLIRTFASNRASPELIKNYAKPVLKERLDVLESPKTTDLMEYKNNSLYYSQIAKIANQYYDIVIIDLNNKIPEEYAKKIYDISSLVLMGINQNAENIEEFSKLKKENNFYRTSKVKLLMGKYNPNSKYSYKNVARMLREKDLPVVVPYNILFSDYCSEGKCIDYLLAMQGIKTNTDRDGKDAYFINMLGQSVEAIDYMRQSIDYGII